MHCLSGSLLIFLAFGPLAAALAADVLDDIAAGQAAYDSGNYEAAIAEWQPLADAGHAGAQFGLGLMYGNGFGVPMDDALALKWYQLAADQGHAQAQCNLAVMYANGWGVSQSDAEALHWYSAAAEGGVLQAQLSLANMYTSGYLETDNPVLAYQWLTIAAKRGDYDAETRRQELGSTMTAGDLAEGDRLAAEWLASHSDLLANR